jgi:hypothetical protein
MAIVLLTVGVVVGVIVWARVRRYRKSPCMADGMTLENAWIVMALRRKKHQ